MAPKLMPSFAEMDKNGDGAISREEFVQAVTGGSGSRNRAATPPPRSVSAGSAREEVVGQTEPPKHSLSEWTSVLTEWMQHHPRCCFGLWTVAWGASVACCYMLKPEYKVHCTCYTAALLALLIHRIWRYETKDCVLFILDLVFVNAVALMVNFWRNDLFPEELVHICAMLAQGPISGVTFSLQTASKLHHPTGFENLFLHALPLQMAYTMRWHSVMTEAPGVHVLISLAFMKVFIPWFVAYMAVVILLLPCEVSRDGMLKAIFKAWDANGDGSLQFEEVVEHYIEASNHKDESKEKVRQAFVRFMQKRGLSAEQPMTMEVFCDWLKCMSHKGVVRWYEKSVDQESRKALAWQEWEPERWRLFHKALLHALGVVAATLAVQHPKVQSLWFAIVTLFLFWSAHDFFLGGSTDKKEDFSGIRPFEKIRSMILGRDIWKLREIPMAFFKMTLELLTVRDTKRVLAFLLALTAAYTTFVCPKEIPASLVGGFALMQTGLLP